MFTTIFHINVCIIFSLIIFSIKFNYVQCNIFASMEDMDTLFKVERAITYIVDLYIKEEEKRLDLVRQNIAKFATPKFLEFTSSENFLQNPTNVYHLIKRFTEDMKPLFTLMKATNVEDLARKMPLINKPVKLPDSEDANQISLALDRLRKVYNLTVVKIASGNISSQLQTHLKLTARDCFKIGVSLYKNKKYETANYWFEGALELLEKEDLKTINYAVIFEYLSFCYYKINNYSKALQFSEELLKIDNTKQEWVKNNIYYRNAMNTQSPETQFQNQSVDEDIENYEKLCRNEKLLDTKSESLLKCYYSTNGSPFLILQPVKLEDIHLKPWAGILHDVIRDQEAKVIKDLALPKLKRSEVLAPGGTGQSIFDNGRISKIGWLHDDDHKVVKTFSKRLEEITGLNLSNGSEPLQVNIYGFGGLYLPHYDYLDYDDKMGNRFATILIYLNDVTAGGATVFPRLKIGVSPQKGSAVMWYNLNKSGENDNLTLHAGCPVLGGIKWVSNKWIKSNFQMFKMPCGTDANYTYVK